MAFDMEIAKTSRLDHPGDPTKHVTVIVYDHQKKLMVPNLETKKTHFNDQYSVHDLDMYVPHLEKHHFFVYREKDGRAGASEMLACLLKVLKELNVPAGGGGHLFSKATSAWARTRTASSSPCVPS